VVGKYVGSSRILQELNRSIASWGIANDARVNLKYVDSEQVEKEGPEAFLKERTGSWFPGVRNRHEGKDSGHPVCQRKKVPFLGSVSGCSVRSLRFPETVQASKEPTVPSLTLKPSSGDT
jgi:CTP synthase